MVDPESLQLGAIGIICVVLIREVFGYIKTRKHGNGVALNKEILEQMRLMNSNHLTTICREINVGNSNVVKAIEMMNKEIGDKIDKTNEGIARLLGRTDSK